MPRAHRRLQGLMQLSVIFLMVLPGCAGLRKQSRPQVLVSNHSASIKPIKLERLPPVSPPPIQLASHQEAESEAPLEPVPVPDAAARSGPAADAAPFPIDLPTALRLAGANNLQIALAIERVEEAYANVAAADASWLPSLNAGVVYNRHNGRIQATEGEIVEVSRGSLFVGGGLGFGNTPLNGGSGGPARLFVDLSLADAFFEPLASRQVADATGANEIAVFNNTLQQAALGYLQLVRAQSRVVVLEDAVRHTGRLAKITGDFARVGEGYEADSQRAVAALARRGRELLQSNEEARVAATNLASILRLDPTTNLFATDQQVVPIAMVSESDSLESLIGQGIAARPEVLRQEAMLAASSTRTDQEHWRPWLPHVYAGFTGGGFGGNGNSDIKGFSDRTDFDVAAVWEWENFGFGNAARRRHRASQHRQAHLAGEQVRDSVAADVTRAYHRVHSRRHQIDAVRSQLEAAEQALQLNFDGIRGAELRPIEAQQAINALVEARLAQVDAVLTYNAAQFALLGAIGLPPQATGLPE